MDIYAATQAVECPCDYEDAAKNDARRQVGVLEKEGKIFPIYTGENKLGRDMSCDITFEEMEISVSKFHAIIEAESDGSFFIMDTNSLNGTSIGKLKIRPEARYSVDDKSELKVGTVSFTIKKFVDEEVVDLSDASEDSEILLPTFVEEEQTDFFPNTSRVVSAAHEEEVDENCTQFDECELLSATPEENTQFEEYIDDKEENKKNENIPSKSNKIDSTEIKKNHENNILELDTQEINTSQSVQIKSTEKTRVGILDMDTQATYQDFSSKNIATNKQKILAMETQNLCRKVANSAQNVLEMETQGAVFTPPRGKQGNKQNLLDMDTQDTQSITPQNVLDMETQPSVFVVPNTPVSTRTNKSKSPSVKLQNASNVLDMDTQSQLHDTSVLDADTQAVGVTKTNKSIQNTSCQSDSESSLNIQYVDTEDSLVEHEELLANTTGKKGNNVSILDIDTQMSPNVRDTYKKHSTRNSSMINNMSGGSHSNILDLETQNDSFSVSVETPDKNKDIFNQSTQLLEPPATPNDESNQSAKKDANIFDMTTQMDNAPTAFDSYFDEGDESSTIANNAVSKFLAQGSQNSDSPAAEVEVEIVPDTQEDDQFFVPDTQDEDNDRVLVPDTQDTAQEKEQGNDSNDMIIPESQDVDDLFVEDTPPSSPISKHKSFLSRNASLNISQIETQLAPTFSQDTAKETSISQIETQLAPTFSQETSISQIATQIAPLFSEDQISMSQIETQLAPSFEDETIKLKDREKCEEENLQNKKEQVKASKSNVSNYSSSMQDVSISQVETQLAPTFDSPETPTASSAFAACQSPLRPALRDPSPGTPRNTSLAKHVSFSKDAKTLVLKPKPKTPLRGIQTVKSVSNILCRKDYSDGEKVILPLIRENIPKSSSPRKQTIETRQDNYNEIDFDKSYTDDEEPVKTSTPKRTPQKRKSRAKTVKELFVPRKDISNSNKSKQNTSKLDANNSASSSKHSLGPSKCDTVAVSEVSHTITKEIQVDNVAVQNVTKIRQSRKSSAKKDKHELLKNNADVVSKQSDTHINSDKTTLVEDSANKRTRKQSKLIDSHSALEHIPGDTIVADVEDIATKDQSEVKIKNVLTKSHQTEAMHIENANKSNKTQKNHDVKNFTDPETLKKSKRNQSHQKLMQETVKETKSDKMNNPTVLLSPQKDKQSSSEDKSAKAETPRRGKKILAIQVNKSTPEVSNRTRRTSTLVETCVIEKPENSKQVDNVLPIKNPQKEDQSNIKQNPSTSFKSPKRGRKDHEGENQTLRTSKRSKSANSTDKVVNPVELESDKQNIESKMEEPTKHTEQETCVVETPIDSLSPQKEDYNRTRQKPSTSFKSPKRGRKDNEGENQTVRTSKRSKSANSTDKVVNPVALESDKQNIESEVEKPTNLTEQETCVAETVESSKQIGLPIKSPQKGDHNSLRQNPSTSSKNPKRGRKDHEDENQTLRTSKRSKSANSTDKVVNPVELESDKQNIESEVEKPTKHTEQETCVAETAENSTGNVLEMKSPQKEDYNSSKQKPSTSSKNPKRGRKDNEDDNQTEGTSKRSKSADNKSKVAESNQQNLKSKIKELSNTHTEKETTLKPDIKKTSKLPQNIGTSGLQQSLEIKTRPQRQAKLNHTLVSVAEPVQENNVKTHLDVVVKDTEETALKVLHPDDNSKIDPSNVRKTTKITSTPSKSKRNTKKETTGNKTLQSTSNVEEPAPIEPAANPEIVNNIAQSNSNESGGNETALIAISEDKSDVTKTVEVKGKSKKSNTTTVLSEKIAKETLKSNTEKTTRETRHHKKQQNKEPEPIAGPSGVDVEDLISTKVDNKHKKSEPVFAHPKLLPREKRTRTSATETSELKRTSKRKTDDTNTETLNESLPAPKRSTRANIPHCLSSEETSDTTIDKGNVRGRQRTTNRSQSTSATRETHKRVESESPSRSSSSSRSSVTAASVSYHSGSESDSFSSVMTNDSIMTQRSARKTEKSKTLVLFSGYCNGSKKLEAEVGELGGYVIDNISNKDCVLVVKNMTRTLKILTMLARGLPIVHEKWITDSKKSGRFLDPWKYLVKDRAYEKKYKFNLKECLEKRRAGKPVLDGYTIMSTASTKPGFQELKGVVENAGAIFLFQRPKVWPKPSLLVSCVEDEGCWAELRYDQFKNKHKPTIVKVDAIWETIQQQQIVTDGFEL